MSKITEITGYIVSEDGTRSEFTIGRDAGWQQWGASTEALGGRVDVLQAMAEAAADTGLLASDSDEEDDEERDEE
jgi:hypothetical protein